MEWLGWLLRLGGAGVVLAGLAHALLPRQLGWTTERLAGTALGDLVVRMHVGFIGLFMVVLGAMTIVAVPDVLAGSPLAASLGIGGAIVFGIRAWCEFTLVGRALAEDAGLSAWWRGLHRAAFVIWPALTIGYGVVAWLSLRG